jgi:UDPglucose 6-dehydrogenase
MNVCMIGTGYVGLVAGTCLSDFGMNVTCVDKAEDKIAALKAGKVPIYELGLGELIQKNVKLGRLHFSTDLEEAVGRCLVIFLAVGTPERPDGSVDLGALFEVVKKIAGCMTEYKVLVTKSTVPVGTAAKIRALIRENLRHKVEFDVVSNPEFLREGAAVNDFLRPDRVVLGADSERALAIMRDIYRPLYLLETPIVATSNETAELIKYAANTILAVKVSYINEIANLCELVGADVYQVATAIGMDKRIGSKFLHAGPGYGGSCFPKDVKAIVKTATEAGYDFKIAKAVIDVNMRQWQRVVEKSREALNGLKGKTIGMLGLAFKPNTDDVREAPALQVARAMLKEGAVIHAYDPVAMDEARKGLPEITCCSSIVEAVDKADMVLIMTEWNEFRDLPLETIKSVLRIPVFYDTRNIYDPARVRKLGFTYLSTGRP